MTDYRLSQVFGVPPPQGLYQIQSSPTGTLGTRNLSRQSLVSLASLAYLLDHVREWPCHPSCFR